MDFSRMLPSSVGFRLIDFDESLNLPGHFHAGHCCIYARSSTPVVEGCVSSALVLMQMRHDGQFGFPGGGVKVGQEEVFSAVNRELEEEIHLNSRFFVTKEDYLFSHVDLSKKLCLHFYTKEVTKEDFEVIEKDVFKAEKYGIETMGIVRVPMFTMCDKYRGFPMFLRNGFAGNARDQLLNFLVLSNLMSSEEVTAALASSREAKF